MQNIEKINTLPRVAPCRVAGCKLLFTNRRFILSSVEVLCDDVLTGEAYRTLEVEELSRFSREHLSRLIITEDAFPIKAPVVYAREGERYRLVTAAPTVGAYAAVCFSLYLKGRVALCETVRVAGDLGELSAALCDRETVTFF